MVKKSGDGDYYRDLEELRNKSQHFHRLESRLKELEGLCNQYKTHSDRLCDEIDTYKSLLEEWDWFFYNSSEMLCVASKEGYFKRVNPAFVRTLGYSEQELLSRPIIDFVHPDDVEKTTAELSKLIESNQDSVNFQNRYRHADGSWHDISWICPALSPGIDNLYAIARDITEKLRYDEHMLYKAMHDALTGLYNRAAFNELLERALARTDRRGNGILALYIVDLDGFKQVNDQLGHSAGDDALVEIAQRFTQVKRQSESVFRLGGDEFAFILEDIEPVEVEPLAQRILETVKRPIRLSRIAGKQPPDVTIGCSIGVALYPNTADGIEELVEQADSAMYDVKRADKNDFKVYSEQRCS